MTTTATTGTVANAAEQAGQKPLWPQPINFIGLTGEYASGKTLLALTICPKETLAYDIEDGMLSYAGSLGLKKRVSMAAEMLKRYPNGYKPIQLFEWWYNDVKQVKPGEYRVIVLDPVSEIEDGLVDWVEKNPGHFGHTSGQYLNMSGLKWGDVKSYWKMILSDIAARCETFAFTSHMTSVWEGNKPVKGKRKAKGKETLMELASLYLQMERKPDDKGKVPDKPSAIVLKHRLMAPRLNEETGEIDIIPLLPPRLPVATPHAIRQYMLNPPDYKKLKKDELAPEHRLTDDEKLMLQASVAEANRETEMLRLEREQRAEKAREVAATAGAVPEKVAAVTAAAGKVASTGNGTATAAVVTAAALSSTMGAVASATTAQQHKCPADRLAVITNLFGQLKQNGLTTEQWKAILSKRGVATARDLTVEQADELIGKLQQKLGLRASRPELITTIPAEGGATTDSGANKSNGGQSEDELWKALQNPGKPS